MKTYRIKFRIGTRYGIATVKAFDEIEAVYKAQIEIEKMGVDA